jgi:branched-chain amino acid transport system ATP-binding protein
LCNVFSTRHLRYIESTHEQCWKTVSLLIIENLNKRYGGLVVTRGVNLDVRDGERHVIIGPNGAGKTTLLNEIGGQVPPDDGRILLAGTDVTDMPPEMRCRYGIARSFQRNTLLQRLSALENVRLGAQAKHGGAYNPFTRVDSIEILRDQAITALRQVGLQDKSNIQVSRLSYGEQRQLEIAVALACSPQLLLLDEPTSGLSPVETRNIITLIKQLPRNVGILMIEHDLHVVFSVADRITVMSNGEIIASGLPAEISNNEHVREIYLGKSF